MKSHPQHGHGKLLTVILLVPLVAVLPACGQSHSSGRAAATTTAPSASQPTDVAATGPAPDDPAAVKILEALEQTGRKHLTIRMGMDYHVDMPELGDSETRSGWVAYQRDIKADDEKIRIHFDTLQQGDGPNRRERLDYTFDGQWAAEAKHNIKQLTRYQVAPPGEKIRALQIGKGPFPPLPFGQKADEVLKFYRATTRPIQEDSGPRKIAAWKPQEGEPKDTDYLLLVARRERQKDLNFTRLEMWVDRQTGLPVRIVGYEKDKNIHTVVLKDLQAAGEFPSDMFELKKGFGWTEEIRPYERE
jgi:hypothetical protein